MNNIVLITGANTGIGFETAKALAAANWRVVLAGRSEPKTREAMARIEQAVPGAQLEFLPVDVANLASVKSAAETFLATNRPLPLLINNAGLAGHRGQTTDGFEIQFGTNHVGHFALTLRLAPALLAASSARVVNVASQAHYKARTIDFEAIRRPTRSITGFPEYCVSKLANVCFNIALAKRIQGTAITTYALHPGVVASDVWRRVPWPIRPLIKRTMLTSEQGAQTSLHCATHPQLQNESGLYYDNCKRKEASRHATTELSEELWRRSTEWTGVDWKP